jgi:hypothetical protein
VVAQGQRRSQLGAALQTPADGEWVLLAYRLPREPSTPRSTVWRKLKRLGVAQVADGLVALPADARTREALEWIAEEVVDHQGEATLWLGRPADRDGLAALVARMTWAVEREYDQLIAEAEALSSVDAGGRGRTLARLRREMRRIRERDFFGSVRSEAAARALDAVDPDGRSRAAVEQVSR